MFIQSPLIESGKVLPLGSSSMIAQVVSLLTSQPNSSDSAQISGEQVSSSHELIDLIKIDNGQGSILQQYTLVENYRSIETNRQMVASLISHFAEQPENPEVILFLLDRNSLDSVRELEFWVRNGLHWMDASTEIVLLCYHSSPEIPPVVSDDTIANAEFFIEQEISSHLPTWIGSCNQIDISNQTQLSINIARNLISRCILRSKGISIMEGIILPAPSYSEYF